MPGRPSDDAATVEIDWCRDAAKAGEIAAFFVAHAGTAYISHSELQTGRAAAVGLWSEDLPGRIEAEARSAIRVAAEGAAAGTRCALALSNGVILGLAFVRFMPEAELPFGVLEDLLVDAARRGQGIGRRFMAWIETQCRAEGCPRLFLESGVENHRAHDVFKHCGFAQTSIVMMRDVSLF